MRELDTTPPMQFYLPLWPAPTLAAAVVMRAAIPPEAAASALRGLVRNMDPALAIAGVSTMDQLVSEANAERRFQTVLLTVFGGISLFLSLLGLYALMAYEVQQRIRTGNTPADLGAARRRGGLWFQPQDVQYQLPQWASPTLIQKEPRQQSHHCRWLKARIKVSPSFEYCRQSFPWSLPKVIEHRSLVDAGDSTKRGTVFGSGTLAH